MNEKQKIFAAGTVVGAATGFGMASFLLMLGALYMAPQLLDTMKQEAMVLHPPSQVQSAPLLFENPLFPMESATDRSEGETQAGRVIHVRAVQGGHWRPRHRKRNPAAQCSECASSAAAADADGRNVFAVTGHRCFGS